MLCCHARIRAARPAEGVGVTGAHIRARISATQDPARNVPPCLNQSGARVVARRTPIDAARQTRSRRVPIFVGRS